MPPLTHITVTAPKGRRTPIHPNDGRDLTGVQLHVVAGVVDRVRWSATIRRAIARGDLIPCDRHGTPVESAEQAAAADELPDGRIVIAPIAPPPAAIQSSPEPATSPADIEASAKNTRSP